MSDWLALGHTAAELETRIKNAPSFREAEDITETAQLGLKLKCGSEIIEKSQEWLISDFLPADTLVVVAGAPGVGKTTACLSWAASITNGRSPITGQTRKPANVLMLSNEDSEAGLRSIFSRLGGNLDRLYVEDEESDHPWGIGDIRSLEAQMKCLNPGLVIIDSLTTHTPAKADMNSHGDMAGLLVALRKLAVASACTIILIHHTNKLQTGNALARISGSIGISATARHVLLVAPHPEDDTARVIAVAKSNLVLPGKISHNFSLDPFSWNGTSTLSGDDLVRVGQENEDGDPSEAEQFLRDALAEGREDSAALIRQAEAGYAIKRRTLQRAANKIGVLREAAGFGAGRRVYWRLPAPIDDTMDDTPAKSVIDGREPVNTALFHAGPTMDDTSSEGVIDVSSMMSSMEQRRLAGVIEGEL